MIEQAIDTRWPVGRLPWIVRNVFPVTLHKSMLDMLIHWLIQARIKGRNPKTWGKRLFQDTAHTEEEIKRPRLDSADMSRSSSS
ncbi:uncharacterized protein F4812DRAFT_420819 [Daldinia caldariorum]|uniref:uncharacterized protein n=1 Tax=Daldinia caldariorum TaxID=326644 RepID=UPI0020071EA2|nr:uncharacterized protein F4812DRAFT_420819 [Daldinia caldariorum]KAI1469911.1 hypothetical protein F4812DRAFT_420819 [Daldinia caldariorum]